jgi:SAM-dependent methyltransferase
MDYKDYQAGTQTKHFWFRAKKQLIKNLFLKITADPNATPLRILDIGAGTGDDIEVLHQFGNVHVIDINQQALDLIPNHLVAEKRLGDACHLPYEDQSFDIVAAFDVLEHIEQDTQVVDEIARILKPGGHLLVTVPAHQWLFSAHDRHLNHVRRYSKKMVKTLLSPLNTVTLGYWNGLLFVPAALERLRNKKQSDGKLYQPAAPINWLLYRTLCVENWLIAHNASLPYGLSLYGIYQKPKTV